MNVNARHTRYLFLVSMSLVLISCGGGGDDGGGGIFNCTYDVFKTTVCSNPYSYTTNQFTECVEVDSNNIIYSPETYCQQVYTDYTFPSTYCTYSYDYTNVTMSWGGCTYYSVSLGQLDPQNATTYRLHWQGQSDLDLTVLTPQRNEITSANDTLVDGCIHNGNNYGIEQVNAEEVMCGPSSSTRTAGFLLIVNTNTAGVSVPFTLEVLIGDQVMESHTGTLTPESPEASFESRLAATTEP